jgi:hypothetical protein
MYCRSPVVVLDSVDSLVKLAVNLDVGTVHSNTVSIVLFVLRIVARIDSFVEYLVASLENRADSTSYDAAVITALRNTAIQSDILHILVSKRSAINHTVRVRIVPMIERWCSELFQECLDKTDDEIMDTNSRISCGLHAHLLLLHRNLTMDDYNFEAASIISSSILFLSSRHTWNLDLLGGVPENEVFEMMMVQRRNLVGWIRRQPQVVLNDLLEISVRVTVGTGTRIGNNNSSSTVTRARWAYVAGMRSRGRFTVVAAHSVDGGNTIQEVDGNIEMGIEVDLQTAQMTLKSSHLQALDTAIASDPDVQMVFGSKSMLAATVQSCEHRKWVHLVGRQHDVHFWCTPDERTAVVDLDRDYAPDELSSSEAWIAPLLEPVRLTYMTQPFVLQICMPERAYPPSAEVAMLIGIHPKLGGTWKGKRTGFGSSSCNRASRFLLVIAF